MAAPAEDLRKRFPEADQADWRLPNKNELISIVEERCWQPARNAAVFPGTRWGLLWSSSPYPDPDRAWYVTSDNGTAHTGSKNGGYGGVRLVRGGQ